MNLGIVIFTVLGFNLSTTYAISPEVKNDIDNFIEQNCPGWYALAVVTLCSVLLIIITGLIASCIEYFSSKKIRPSVFIIILSLILIIYVDNSVFDLVFTLSGLLALAGQVFVNSPRANRNIRIIRKFRWLQIIGLIIISVLPILVVHDQFSVEQPSQSHVDDEVDWSGYWIATEQGKPRNVTGIIHFSDHGDSICGNYINNECEQHILWGIKKDSILSGTWINICNSSKGTFEFVLEKPRSFTGKKLRDNNSSSWWEGTATHNVDNISRTYRRIALITSRCGEMEDEFKNNSFEFGNEKGDKPKQVQGNKKSSREEEIKKQNLERAIELMNKRK